MNTLKTQDKRKKPGQHPRFSEVLFWYPQCVFGAFSCLTSFNFYSPKKQVYNPMRIYTDCGVVV